MSNIKRVFIYLILFSVILAISNAMVQVLRSLFDLQQKYYSAIQLANSIAILLVGIPVYLFLWIWIQRKAREPEERTSFVRMLYLYLIILIMTDYLVHNCFSFLRSSLYLILNFQPYSYQYFLSPQQYLLYYAIPIFIYSGIWVYHWRLIRQNNKDISDNSWVLTFRQLYSYLSAGTGLAMGTLALINILRWILEKIFYPQPNLLETNFVISSEVARIIIGTILWFIFWTFAQRAYANPLKEERSSVIRKIYLYLVLFLSIILVVISASFVLVDVFNGWLGLPASPDPTAKFLPISIFAIIGMIWIYHNSVLKKDASLEEEIEQQANVRRIFTYLMAGVGFAALSISLGGVVSVLIRSVYHGVLLQDLRKQLSWFSALLIIGTPLWLIYWQRAQKNAEESKAAGYNERRSFIRTYYLYFFTYLAAITIIGSLVFIVAQLVEILMGLRSFSGLMTDIGQSLSYSLISLVIILYHRLVLQKDTSSINSFEKGKGKALNFVLFDAADGITGKSLLEKLGNIGGISITPIALSSSAAKTMELESDRKTYSNEISNAQGIVGKMNPMNQEILGNNRYGKLLRAISTSHAYKLIIPAKEEGTEWLGVDIPDERKVLAEVRNFIRQIRTEGKARRSRKFTALAILMLIAISFCFFSSILIPLLFILDIF